MRNKIPIAIIIGAVIIGIFIFSGFLFTGRFIDDGKQVPEPITKFDDNGVVTKVIDGDTVIINGDSVRLLGMDADEKGKKGYEESKEFLTEMILDKQVRLEKDISDKDEYGRLLRYAYVNISGVEFFVNKQLVQEGYGKVFRYGNDTSKCDEIEWL